MHDFVKEATSERLFGDFRYTPSGDICFAKEFVGFAINGIIPPTWSSMDRQKMQIEIMDFVTVEVGSKNEIAEIIATLDSSLLSHPLTRSNMFFRTAFLLESGDDSGLKINKELLVQMPSFIFQRQSQMLEALSQLNDFGRAQFDRSYRDVNSIVKIVSTNHLQAQVNQLAMGSNYYYHTFAFHFARICTTQPMLGKQGRIRQAQIDTIGTVLMFGVQNRGAEPTILCLDKFSMCFNAIEATMQRTRGFNPKLVVAYAAKYAQVFCMLNDPQDPSLWPKAHEIAQIMAKRHISTIALKHADTSLAFTLYPEENERVKTEATNRLLHEISTTRASESAVPPIAKQLAGSEPSSSLSLVGGHPTTEDVERLVVTTPPAQAADDISNQDSMVP